MSLENKENIKEEINEMLLEKTEAEKKQEFLNEYQELVKKHGYDFFQQPPTIIKVNFVKNPNE